MALHESVQTHIGLSSSRSVNEDLEIANIVTETPNKHIVKYDRHPKFVQNRIR